MSRPVRNRPSGAAADRVREVFARCGFVRAPNPERVTAEGPTYHKGWEVRFVLDSSREVVELARLLRQTGLRHGSPYLKRTQFVLPVYGRPAVEWLAPERALIPGAPRPARKSVPRIPSAP